MKDHVIELIDPFLDGELDPAHTTQIAEHIEKCLDCKQAIIRRQKLSALVKDVPGVIKRKSDVDFAREIFLRIDNAAEISTKNPPTPDLGWIGIPILLVIGLALIQAVWLASSVVGTLPQVGEAVESGRFLMPFAFALPSALDSLITYVLGLNNMSWHWSTAIILSAALGFIYVSWLAGWWVKGQKQANA